jgi:diguanylate cyclase (GGDEF)-like protein
MAGHTLANAALRLGFDEEPAEAATVSGWRWLARHRYAGPAVAFAGTLSGYVVLGRCGYQLIGASAGLSSFWPATGFVLGLLVLAPRQLRLWILAAVIPAEGIADALQGYSRWTALGWGLTAILESGVGAWVLLKVAGRRPSGEALRDFFALGVAALAAPLLGGITGAAVSVASFGGSYGEAWVNWWRGDATGIMLVVPLVFAFARPGRKQPTLPHHVGMLEVAFVVGVTAAIFGLSRQPLEFLIVPPLVLLAVRRDLRLTAIANLSSGIAATILTGRGLGPLSIFRSIETRVLGLQLFIATSAFIAFLIYAAIAERTLAERGLANLAMQDPLTGLANRRRFMERLEELAAYQSRSAEQSAVVYLDLDGFKQINDEIGHAAGDAVLAEVARRLRAATRACDLVARIGGDEFGALLAPVDGLGGATNSAGRITAAIEQPFMFAGDEIPIRVSAGIALTGPDHGASLAEADMRLYREKSQRRRRAALCLGH